jgi:hypothetical protein
MGRDGWTWNGLAWVDMVWDGLRWVGMGWDGLGRDEMGWDGLQMVGWRRLLGFVCKVYYLSQAPPELLQNLKHKAGLSQ